MLRLLRPRRAALPDPRALFSDAVAAVQGAAHGAPTSPLAKALGGDAAARAAFLEDQRQQGSQAFRDGVNMAFKTLDVPLSVEGSATKKVEGSATKKYDDMSAGKLRERLAALKIEVSVIERQLAQTEPSKDASSGAVASEAVASEADPPKAISSEDISSDPFFQGAVADSEEGEVYEETDRLTRRLKKWWTLEASTHVPYQMMHTFDLYPQWIPWCQSGQVLKSHPTKGVTRASVGFGINVPFIGTLGDNIEYRVELSPPDGPHGACRVYTISEESRYMERLGYDWRFVPLDENRTKVVLEVEFKGAAYWCMPVWEALRKDVISDIATAFHKRVAIMQASVGGEEDRPKLMPRLEQVSAVLQGPFLRDDAVVITEANGRTIRHANAGFAKLAGRPLLSVVGKDIPDLLQNVNTDKTVLKGLGEAIRRRIPATAMVLNQNMAGEQFMNRLTLAPLDDDEKDTGVVFWAILRVIDEGKDQRLEYSEPDALNKAWGPDYRHPDAIHGQTILAKAKGAA